MGAGSFQGDTHSLMLFMGSPISHFDPELTDVQGWRTLSVAVATTPRYKCRSFGLAPTIWIRPNLDNSSITCCTYYA